MNPWTLATYRAAAFAAIDACREADGALHWRPEAIYAIASMGRGWQVLSTGALVYGLRWVAGSGATMRYAAVRGPAPNRSRRGAP
jgi:hypothetical protein